MASGTIAINILLFIAIEAWMACLESPGETQAQTNGFCPKPHRKLLELMRMVRNQVPITRGVHILTLHSSNFQLLILFAYVMIVPVLLYDLWMIGLSYKVIFIATFRAIKMLVSLVLTILKMVVKICGLILAGI